MICCLLVFFWCTIPRIFKQSGDSKASATPYCKNLWKVTKRKSKSRFARRILPGSSNASQTRLP